MKHLLKISDLTKEDFNHIMQVTEQLKKEQKAGQEHHILKGKTLGMVFSKSSTRTRVSFEVGMYQLGGYALFLSSNDIQLGRGETIYDTANVLSRFLDGIMIRTFKQSDVEDLARFGSIPIINGLTDDHHPCQALADLFTLYEYKGKLEGLKLAYVGDGNNVANSLMEACALAGVNFAVATPKGYECDPAVTENAKRVAEQNGCTIEVTDEADAAVFGADAVYTDTWVSMGQEEEKAKRIEIFKPYQVNEKLMKKANSAIFLHCLPAYRGYEVTEEIIDSPISAIFDEAENRMHAQNAVMTILMGGKG